MHQAVAARNAMALPVTNIADQECNALTMVAGKVEKEPSTTFASHAVAAMEAEIDAMALEHLIDTSAVSETTDAAQLAEYRARIADLELQVEQLEASLIQSDWAPQHSQGLVTAEHYRVWALEHGTRTTLSAHKGERKRQLAQVYKYV